MSKKLQAGDFFGAFADGAILFPLIAALSISSGFSGVNLLAGSGLAYIASGFIFKVPMSVQPLKSIAIAAVAAGASSGEVRWSGAILGVFCLLISLLNVDRIAKNIPVVLIHGIQAGLGVILIHRGLHNLAVAESTLMMKIIPILFIGAVLWAPNFKGLSAMGLVATLGMGYAIFAGHAAQESAGTSTVIPLYNLRPTMILALVLPQMALTLANSVVATKDVCHRYFGGRAQRVTIRNLLLSIGGGNILMAIFSSLPFCHGAGGVTAHYRAGARTWSMNLIIGSFLLALAIAQYQNSWLVIRYPTGLLSVLLVATGFFHLKLSADSWTAPKSRYQIIAMSLVAAASQNILWVLCIGIASEFGLRLVERHPVSSWKRG